MHSYYLNIAILKYCTSVTRALLLPFPSLFLSSITLIPTPLFFVTSLSLDTPFKHFYFPFLLLSLGQFHQHSTISFYVRKLPVQFFLCLRFRFVLYWCKPTGAKAVCRMLMKLSPYLNVSFLSLCNFLRFVLAFHLFFLVSFYF
jgi:hypothetical protein